MTTTNIAESWIDIYDNYKDVVNFTTSDFESIKASIKQYVTLQNPEKINDWAESSEMSLFVNGLTYIGENILYRVDLNAHDVFPSTTERRESLLNFVKMLSYYPKRNICANGIAKITSIKTTQELSDTYGTELKNIVVNWNDSSNTNWYEQFLLIMNSVFSSTNPYGKPLKRVTNNAITTQTYEINSTNNNSTVYSFSANINDNYESFEVVNPDLDLTYKTIYERTPVSEEASHILYRTDGSGNASKNTGFFVFFKQGSLHQDIHNFDEKIENNSVSISYENINENDVWVQQVNSDTGVLIKNWVKIDNDEYLVYNTQSNEEREIYKVETKDKDTIVIRFSDGKFGTIPLGKFKIWYRVSNGNENLYIKSTDIQNIEITIPYKSSDTTDDNVYYLTLTFSVQDISHINQSVVQESLEEIRERGPQVYSTQNRMVSAKDYNLYPKSFGNQIKVLNSVVRTYAGNSRYVNLNDPTGTYSDLNLISEDGFIYKDEGLNKNQFSVENYNTPVQIITNHIEPMVDALSLSNFYYNHYLKTSYKYNDSDLVWYETDVSSSVSYGMLKTTSGTIVPYSKLSTICNIGSSLKFVNSKDEAIWAKITNISNNNINKEDDYEIEINEVLPYQYTWTIGQGYMNFNTSLSKIRSKIVSKLKDYAAFGIRYDVDNGMDIVEDFSLLSDDDTDFSIVEDISQCITPGSVTDWLIKFEYNSNIWLTTVRYTDYVFGSEGDTSFFFNTDTKNDNQTFETSDYVKVLKTQTVEDKNFDTDYYWKPCNTIKYVDGYTDTKKFNVYAYDDDKDSMADNPRQYDDMNPNEKIFFNIGESTNEVISDVVEIDSLWGHTTTTSYYYCKTSGTIFKAGSVLPKDITLTKNVRMSDGSIIYASITNPYTFKKDNTEPYPYDIVDDGYKDYYNDEGEFVSEEIGSELVYWNATDKELTRLTENTDYFIKYGLKSLTFLWKHYASADYLIDPCTTNIIDMYVLTNTYYNNVQNWLKSDRTDSFPKLSSSYELKALFNTLEEKSMASDTLIWHPVKYKLLFGSEADNEYKATFRVIKDTNTTLSDNEIKQLVVESIDSYFSTMGVGQKFYFTKLSTYIDNAIGKNIGTVLIVPSYNNDKFGNLFEINCDEDEILLSSASIDDVQIISKITNNNIKIGN